MISIEQVDLNTGIDVVRANETSELKADTWVRKLEGF